MSENVNLFVPIITRLVEGENNALYVFGVIPFDEPDTYNTVLTRELIEANIPRLRKYPALRFMHHDPLGTIVFDRYITDPTSGKELKTEVRPDGFAVLSKVDDACTKERSLILNGHFGYSYGYSPDKPQPIRASVKDGVMRTHFTTGTVLELSIVDTPSNWTAETKTYVRIIQSDNGETPASQQPQTEGKILEQKDIDIINGAIEASEKRMIAAFNTAVAAIKAPLTSEEVTRIIKPLEERIAGMQKTLETLPNEHSPANQTQNRDQPTGTRAMIEAAYQRSA